MQPAASSTKRGSSMSTHRLPSTHTTARSPMRAYGPLGRAMAVPCLAAGALLPATAARQVAQPTRGTGGRQITATLFGWVPTTNGKIKHPGVLGSTHIPVPSHQTLAHL